MLIEWNEWACAQFNAEFYCVACLFAKWILTEHYLQLKSLPHTWHTHVVLLITTVSLCICACARTPTGKSHNWYQLRYWYLTVEHKKKYDINFIKCDYMIMIVVYLMLLCTHCLVRYWTRADTFTIHIHLISWLWSELLIWCWFSDDK